MTSAQMYADKRPDYFGAVGHHILARLPAGPLRVLEFGCGNGATGAAAKALRPELVWTGVEIVPGAAREARGVLDNVLEGDIAAFSQAELGAPFDAIVASEVLEHLLDPWQVVRDLAGLLRPGGLFVASSPNIANRQVIRELVMGRFEYREEGVMDQTHLRWFTPASFARLFTDAGLQVLSCEPLTVPGSKARWINRLTGDRFSHLFMTQIVVVARAK